MNTRSRWTQRLECPRMTKLASDEKRKWKKRHKQQQLWSGGKNFKLSTWFQSCSALRLNVWVFYLHNFTSNTTTKRCAGSVRIFLHLSLQNKAWLKASSSFGCWTSLETRTKCSTMREQQTSLVGQRCGGDELTQWIQYFLKLNWVGSMGDADDDEEIKFRFRLFLFFIEDSFSFLKVFIFEQKKTN